MAKKKKNLPKILVIGAVVLLALVIAGSKLGWFGDGAEQKVAVDEVKEQTVFELVSASGKVKPEFEVKLSSEVSGEIIELNVKEGDVVKKGQVLCRVKPDLLQSSYDRAAAQVSQQKANNAAAQQVLKQQEANLVNIEATYKRSQELYGKRVISASEMDKARADYESARASLESQRQQVVASRYAISQSEAQLQEAGNSLSRTTIYAPSDGIISLLSIELGERVVGTAQMAGTEIMRIANMSTMEVNVEVNENDINRVKVGNEATIEVDAFQGRKFKGVVTEISSSSKSAATTATTAEQVTNFNVKVRIEVSSYEDLLDEQNVNSSPFKPGLSATVQIHTKSEKGLTVPIQAVTIRTKDKTDSVSNDDIKEYVFVLNGDVVKMTEVKTGIQDDKNIIVKSGLKKGESVVSRPFNAISKILQDGTKVKKVSASELK
ncbi:efflux RND transporter periplasmic adaptor subunit [Sphingobacterium psychroaquaticum]|uniref:HlyD family secretion protein n=1 Tax=Sphingobacterium psychroaquaticum TaxID=561061 RepID=A0A1X7HXJ4_9SPHI|nr:efflux RND transporter periplasmic adaptor subunit [Sphingobacterium psychroaquaticum]QBQ42139.1 efflux RND transporter periplasmic adaptor subunit [Sphingobacterium psychroaquaticum]SMG06734.1 HlyD family secretion protein [Sphingobacterium psychroaquaticum]